MIIRLFSNPNQGGESTGERSHSGDGTRRAQRFCQWAVDQPEDAVHATDIQRILHRGIHRWHRDQRQVNRLRQLTRVRIATIAN